MARIRTIKPDYWTDEAVVELEFWERLLFIGLWNFADDQGFLLYSPKRIKMQVFPADDVDVSRGLARLLEVSLLEAFDVLSTPGAVLLRVKGWDKHQRVSNPAIARFHPADLQERSDLPESSVGLARALEPYPAEGKGREGKGSSSSSPAGKPARDEEGFHPEADKLCTTLAQMMVENGNREPSITKDWRTEARLLLARDGIDFDLAMKVLQWSQRDQFWKNNIHSMPTFRKQFDKLRGKRKEQAEQGSAADGREPEPDAGFWSRRETPA
jgi:hypothetical protein